MQIHDFLPLLVSLKVFTRAVLILQAKDVSKTEYELVAAWDAGRSRSGDTLIVHKGPRAAGQGVFWKPTERFANRKSVKFCEWILIWISEQKQIFTSWRAAGDLLSDLTLWPTVANSQSFWWQPSELYSAISMLFDHPTYPVQPSKVLHSRLGTKQRRKMKMLEIKICWY